MRKRVKKSRYMQYLTGYLMLAPFLILFLIFVIVPIVWGFGLSFTNYNIVQSPKFAGFSNYIELFTNDELFFKAFKNTFVFALIAGPVGFMSSFFFAWVINQLKFRNAFSLAFYVPSIVSGVAISVVWLYLFSNDRFGLVNSILIRLGLMEKPIEWTLNPTYIVPLIILVSVWMSLGSGFLTNLAGLNNISLEIYEAGRLDGIRNKMQEMVLLTLPQMKPQLLFNAIMSTVASLNIADLATSIAGNPSPDYAAYTIVMHLFDYAYTRFELGYASAIAFVLFMFNFLLGQFFMKVLGTKD